MTHMLLASFKTAFGICSLPQAIKGDADILLKGVRDKNTIEDVKRIVELVHIHLPDQSLLSINS